jgi:hypothetical protein
MIGHEATGTARSKVPGVQGIFAYIARIVPVKIEAAALAFISLKPCRSIS